MERLVFLFLLEEPHSEGSCEIRFVGKVIEMSEKEPGSLETTGVIQVSRELFKYSSVFQRQ